MADAEKKPAPTPYCPFCDSFGPHDEEKHARMMGFVLARAAFGAFDPEDALSDD
jgi:hypothetical protein